MKPLEIIARQKNINKNTVECNPSGKVLQCYSATVENKSYDSKRKVDIRKGYKLAFEDNR